MFATNLHNTGAAIDSTFEYMDRTPFSTFDAFVGAKSQYVYNMPKDLDANLALKYKNTLSNGLNYSLAYQYAYEKDPIINIRWKDTSGNTLKVTTATVNGSSDAGDNYVRLGLKNLAGTVDFGGYASWSDGSGGYNSSQDADKLAILELEQTVERAQSFGSAMDFALDTQALGPVVLRGEFVYTKGAKQPVVDRGWLSMGHLPKALTMRDADKFKYVLGADITVNTDMMVSAQFIQDRNLDYIDNKTDYDGTACSSVTSANCGSYTVDYASMSLTNQFNKAIKNKEFLSLFLSKPFGDSGQGRWNNILMLEEGGGRWNRFDVEYSVNNNLIATAEYNKYWGDENSQFGQLEGSSNIQLGMKYLFE